MLRATSRWCRRRPLRLLCGTLQPQSSLAPGRGSGTNPAGVSGVGSWGAWRGKQAAANWGSRCAAGLAASESAPFPPRFRFPPRRCTHHPPYPCPAGLGGSLDICCLGAWCPCILFGRNMEELEGPSGPG